MNNETIQTGGGNTSPILQPFPIDTLPLPLQQYVKECTNTLNFHHDFISVATLFSYGYAVGNSLALEVQHGWKETPSIFCAFVAPSGIGKTHPVNFALQPLQRIDADYLNKYKDEIQTFKLLDKQEKELSPKPMLKQLILNDATLEGLSKAHAENPNGLVVVRDEIASWLQDFNKYRGGSDETQWLSIWSGQTIKVTRASKDEPLIIEKPCVSVIGGTQPSFLSLFASNGRSVSGFIDRVLFVFPDDVRAQHVSTTEPNTQVLNVHDKAIKLLHDLTKNERYTVRFSMEAKEEFIHYQNHNRDCINEATTEWEKSLFAKSDNHVLRIALCLQSAMWVHNEITNLDVLSNDVLHKAITISDWFTFHAYKVRNEVQSIMQQENKPELVQRLHKSGMSIRDIEHTTKIPRSTVHRLLA